MNKYQEAWDFINIVSVSTDRNRIMPLKELVDKEIPVKPEYISLLTNPPQNRTRCGNCKGAHLEKVFKFCPYCGKKIDWSDSNE